MSARLEIENLSHRYPGTVAPALDSVTFDVEEGEILALIGGSGSGKSTLLRAIAGLERPVAGTIRLAGRTITGPRVLVQPERRRIGMVSQSGDLFPHLNLLHNVAYGLRRLPRPRRRERALEMLELVGLAGFAERFPAELSGGEAQRAALARSLAFQPAILLLDEPFSNLDAGLRERLRGQTLDLLRRENITSIFVTHHGDDALAAGDRLAVFREGRLIQLGTPREVWEKPTDAGVAALFGGVNLIPGKDPQRPICLRADQLRLCPDDVSCLACGTVERVDFLGACQQVVLRLPGSEHPVRVRIPNDHPVFPGSRFGIDRRE